jgi:hypothetical protein
MGYLLRNPACKGKGAQEILVLERGYETLYAIDYDTTEFLKDHIAYILYRDILHRSYHRTL